MQPGAGQQEIPKIALPNIKNMVAVASGKGGVGKSTVAANLALALQQHGQKVGLMDGDIYGPSVPTMMGVPGPFDRNTTQFPIEKYGLKLMSMGFLVDKETPMIWRGPMVSQYITAFLTQIDWGPLDFLIVDMPPGTGDAQLTLCQTAPMSGAVIVTTPQEVSLIDARKGLEMFNNVKVPVIGVIENMSYFVGDDGKRYDIFRHGGGKKMAEATGVPFLGEIPIDTRVAECGDNGEPIVQKHPDTPIAKSYLQLANTVIQELSKIGKQAPLPGLEM